MALDCAGERRTTPAFDGNPSWRVRRRLRDGATVTVRPVVPTDRDELRREFLRHSPNRTGYDFMAWARRRQTTCSTT